MLDTKHPGNDCSSRHYGFRCVEKNKIRVRAFKGVVEQGKIDEVNLETVLACTGRSSVKA